jgi:hypothetical protein
MTAKTLDVGERQQILRLLVKEILVDANSLTIRHSIPIPKIGSGSNNAQPPNSTPSGTSQKPHYLLRSGSNAAASRYFFITDLHGRDFFCERLFLQVSGLGTFNTVRVRRGLCVARLSGGTLS